MRGGVQVPFDPPPLLFRVAAGRRWPCGAKSPIREPKESQSRSRMGGAGPSFAGLVIGLCGAFAADGGAEVGQRTTEVMVDAERQRQFVDVVIKAKTFERR